MKKVEEKLHKEKLNLEKLIEKRNSINEKIKAKEIEISKYEDMLKKDKFDSINSVLNANGLTIDEIMAAVKNGNLDTLQKKINNTNSNE